MAQVETGKGASPAGTDRLPVNLLSLKANDPAVTPWRRALQDAWFEATGYTDDGKPPHEGQIALHHDEHRYRCLAKGRRGGGTTSAAREAEAEAMLWAGLGSANIGIFAPTKELTSRIFDMIWRCLVVRQMIPPEWIILPAELRTVAPRERKIMLAWGAMIAAYSLDAEMPGEGLGFKLVIVDEAGHKNFNHLTWWSSIYPTLLDQGGRGLIVGAAKQDGQTFRELRRLAASDPDWSTHKFPSVLNPVNDPADIERARSTMPAWLFRQEFEAEDVDIGDSPWSEAEVLACVDDSLPLRRPYDPRLAFADGWDLAKTTDWTVGITLEASGICRACDGTGTRTSPPGERTPCPACEKGRIPHEVYAYDRFHRVPWPVTEGRMAERQREYRSLVNFDSTGIGGVTSDHLEIPLPNLWRKSKTAPPGFVFTGKSKAELIINLQRMIQRREIRFPNIPQLVKELLDYRWDDDAIPETDSVMALALAAWAVASRRTVSIEWL